MDPLQIPCPECGRVLRLRDRARLGTRGKCPKCAHKFVLQPPAAAEDEVQMELVDSTPVVAEASSQPAVGTSARWIPDEPAAAQFEPLPTVAQTAAQPPAKPSADFDIRSSTEGGISQLHRMRRKGSKGKKIGIAVGVVTALAVTLVVVAVQMGGQSSDEKPPPTVNREYQAEKQDLKEQLVTAQKASPTKGDPIKLLYVPSGSRIIINVHPAALWENASAGEEFRACLGGKLNTWMEDTLKEICRFEPAEIEEAMICLIPEGRTTAPKIAAVVHLKEEQKKSDLILGFGAERDDSHGRPVYKNDEHAFILIDTKTFAVGPRDSADQMINAMKFPLVTDTDVEELIRHTDRDRHFTILFEPADLRNYRDVLVPEEALPFLNLFIDWFGEDVSTVAWSLHLGDEQFHSEMLLRNGGGGVSSPRRVYKEFDRRLDELPHEVLAAVSKMEPERLGFRKIIGRFPAMVMGYSAATTGGIGDRYVQLTTVLPERAAPNLAVGLSLTFAESLRTDFTKAAPDLSKPKLPDLLADRLKAKIEIDFRRTPLHEAFAYIGEESHVTFDLDGDALKDKGMTQNMAQNQQLGEVPAIDAIYAIIGGYKDEGMCVVVDEGKKVATVMTLKFLEVRGVKESSTVKILRPTDK
ncbi:MAG: hypothetical protein HOL01_00755 [Planctomycetaceae bacterium]|nr:hypothetical protein [Planctomycetaceae bacterium]MBT6493054.1 hypothetical protein [Planctomycetaceae bacterium]